MQTLRLPYLTLYQLYNPLLSSLHADFVIPVPVGWSLSSLHVKGPVNQLG